MQFGQKAKVVLPSSDTLRLLRRLWKYLNQLLLWYQTKWAMRYSPHVLPCIKERTQTNIIPFQLSKTAQKRHCQSVSEWVRFWTQRLQVKHCRAGVGRHMWHYRRLSGRCDEKILICFLSGRFVRFNRQHSLGTRAVSKLFNEKERRVWVSRGNFCDMFAFPRVSHYRSFTFFS